MPKKKRRRPRRSKAKQSSGRSKPSLTMQQMLDRIPDKDWLDTPEVQYVFGGVHEVTVYKWVGQGKLEPYRVKANGKANIYKREDVVALVKARFTPRPAGGGKRGGKKAAK